MPPRTIRLVPQLSVAALQHGFDKELAMWYCLRAINHWGSGHLDLQMAIEVLVLHFHYSKSSAYRILSAGDGLFWNRRPIRKINRLYLQIYGLKKVARYFDTRCSRYFVEVTPQDFVGAGDNRVSVQRSWLYASFHKPEGTKSHPIFRAALQEATGVHRRSQQRYDKTTVTCVANYADTQDTLGKVAPILELVDGKCRQWLVHKRLGNTYYCKAKRSAAGMLRKVNTAVGQSFIGGEACYLRRFFMTARSYIKSRHRHEDSYITVPVPKRWITWRMEWCRVNP
ncbi:hypothetical protein ACFLYC_00550 [Chloroflexota bacterium]